MATLSDLVEAVAAVSGLPRATVFAYGRFARQAGLIGQSGRGRSAATMANTDAANLLLAIAGTGVTRQAGWAVETFGRLKDGRCRFFWGDTRSKTLLMDECLRFLHACGLQQTPFPPPPGDDRIRFYGEFGVFFEFLIASTTNGRLVELFRNIPSAAIPADLRADWREKGSPHLHKTMEQLIKEGLVAAYSATELRFGEQVGVRFRFDRLVPSVDVEFVRIWDLPQVVAVVSFGPDRQARARGQHRLQLAAEFTQHMLAAVALVVSNEVRASSIRGLKAIDACFADQFRNPETSGDGR